MKQGQILEFLKQLRESAEPIYEIYTNGSCFRLCMMLRAICPQAVPMYSQEQGHWITEIDGCYYDIGGELESSYVHGDNAKFEYHPEWEASAALCKWSKNNFSTVYSKYVNHANKFWLGVMAEACNDLVVGEFVYYVTDDIVIRLSSVSVEKLEVLQHTLYHVHPKTVNRLSQESAPNIKFNVPHFEKAMEELRIVSRKRRDYQYWEVKPLPNEVPETLWPELMFRGFVAQEASGINLAFATDVLLIAESDDFYYGMPLEKQRKENMYSFELKGFEILEFPRTGIISVRITPANDACINNASTGSTNELLRILRGDRTITTWAIANSIRERFTKSRPMSSEDHG